VAATPVGNIPMTNVIGVVRGENPTVLILGGHYDTARLDGVRFVGANDGGSSAAFLLEMARVLGSRRTRPSCDCPRWGVRSYAARERVQGRPGDQLGAGLQPRGRDRR
jgi:Zn-dependent M28 family amino/carboxypeptidase